MILQIITVKTVDEVLKIALIKELKPIEWIDSRKFTQNHKVVKNLQLVVLIKYQASYRIFYNSLLYNLAFEKGRLFFKVLAASPFEVFLINAVIIKNFFIFDHFFYIT